MTSATFIQISALLFPAHNILPQDGDAYYFRSVFTKSEADAYQRLLLDKIDWQEGEIILFGKRMKIPRLQAWYGEKTYTYSGVKLDPLPWTEVLLEIKNRVEPLSGVEYNSVLLNLYRNGNDSMGWHSDDEKELGRHPVIGSVSFGHTRMFHLRHKTAKLPTIKQALHSGSFLLMKDEIQENWKHQIPKSKLELKPRINLTFRKIV